MDSVYIMKAKVLDLYAEQSRWVDMALKFILGLCVFFYIDKNMGYMAMLAKGFIPVVLAIGCAFAPLTLMVILAAGVIIAHSFALSYGLAAMVGGIFLVMFIVYFQYTSKQVLVLMLTPVAFVLNLPFAIPIAFGLLGNPFSAIPVCCGVLVYYLLEAIKVSADTFAGVTGTDMLAPMITFAKEFALNKEMWLMMAVMSISIIVVSAARRFAIPYSWKIAMFAGVLTNILTSAVIASVLEVENSLGSVMLGSFVGILIGLILEIFFFAVEYRKTEHLMFDDDDYYYYVTAVPKILIEEEEEEGEFEEGELEEEPEESESEKRQKQLRRERARRKRQLEMRKTENKISQTMIMSTNKVEQELRKRVSKTKNTQTQVDSSDADKQLLEEAIKKEFDSQ